MVNSKWKEYEWLVAKLIHDEDTSATSRTVTYDKKVLGKISRQQRQIDILIEEKINGIEAVTIVDCKDRKRNIDIKSIESFIGMVDDVKADYGIIYSPKGYTSGAISRIEDRTDIILLYFDWESANIIRETASIPNRLQDSCVVCCKDNTFPGLLVWEHAYPVIVDGIFCLYATGQCLRCKTEYIWCESCGIMTPVSDNDFTCPQCKVNYP